MNARLRAFLATPARLTALAGYVNLAITVVVNILSMRLALKNLSTEECAVWVNLSATLGLFLLLDFGVSSASSRMLAEPLGNKDQKEVDSWWTVTVVVMFLQGLLLLVLGLACQHLILRYFFNTPLELLPQARMLWCVMVAGAALKIPFQAFASILFCQNRFYHMHIGSTFSQCANFIVFAGLIPLGYGLNSYLAAFSLSIVVMAFWWWWMVRRSKAALHFSLPLFQKEKLKILFGYSNHVFIAGLATQATVLVQLIIVNNLFGAGASTPFSTCTRSSNTIGQVLSRTSEAKVPSWWARYLEGKPEAVAAEFRNLAMWFIPLTLFSVAGLMVFNRLFITLALGSPGIYQGRYFDAMAGLLLLVQQVLKALQFVFPMSRHTRGWATVSVIDAALSLGLGYLFGHFWGMGGLLLGSALGTLLSSMPYTFFLMPRLLRSSARECYGTMAFDMGLGTMALAGVFALLRQDQAVGWFLSPAECWGALVVVLLGAWVFLRMVRTGMLKAPFWIQRIAGSPQKSS